MADHSIAVLFLQRPTSCNILRHPDTRVLLAPVGAHKEVGVRIMPDGGSSSVLQPDTRLAEDHLVLRRGELVHVELYHLVSCGDHGTGTGLLGVLGCTGDILPCVGVVIGALSDGSCH